MLLLCDGHMPPELSRLGGCPTLTIHAEFSNGATRFAHTGCSSSRIEEPR